VYHTEFTVSKETGTKLRVKRSIQSEGAFGVLKEDRQFDRFLTRGKQNVKTELLLLCFGYNVNKLHAKIQNERCGKEALIKRAVASFFLVLQQPLLKFTSDTTDLS
jgi:transposase